MGSSSNGKMLRPQRRDASSILADSTTTTLSRRYPGSPRRRGSKGPSSSGRMPVRQTGNASSILAGSTRRQTRVRGPSASRERRRSSMGRAAAVWKRRSMVEQRSRKPPASWSWGFKSLRFRNCLVMRLGRSSPVSRVRRVRFSYGALNNFLS